MICYVFYHLIYKQYYFVLLIIFEDIINKLIPEHHTFVHNYRITNTLRQ